MKTNRNNNKSEIILTGDRATGPLHLGHYVGSLKQRVSLQHEHDQTILVADMQGLTDNAHNPAKVSSNILNVVDPLTKIKYRYFILKIFDSYFILKIFVRTPCSDGVT